MSSFRMVHKSIKAIHLISLFPDYLRYLFPLGSLSFAKWYPVEICTHTLGTAVTKPAVNSLKLHIPWSSMRCVCKTVTQHCLSRALQGQYPLPPNRKTENETPPSKFVPFQSIWTCCSARAADTPMFSLGWALLSQQEGLLCPPPKRLRGNKPGHSQPDNPN